MAYLDDTGLAHFWDKIKQWIASAASNLVHRTGAEAIDGRKTFVSSETLPAGEGSNASQITEVLVSNPTISKGTETQDRNAYTQIVFTDSSQDRDSGRVMSVFYKHPSETDPKSVAHFALDYINSNNLSKRTELVLSYDPDTDVAYAMAPATSSSRNNSTDIVTRGWIPNDTRIVHTTGTETVGGEKYFSLPVCITQPFAKGTNPASTSYRQFCFTDSSNVNSSLTRAGCLESVLHPSGDTSLFMRSYKWEANSSDHAYLNLRYPRNGIPAIATNASISMSPADGTWLFVNHPDMVKGTLPSEQKSFWSVWADSAGTASAANAFVTNWIGLRTSGETVWRMSVSRNVVNGNDWASLELIQKADGTKYATAPSTPASGNANDIVTRDFIASDSRVVHTTGNESIAGTKVFTDDAWITNSYPMLSLKDTDVARGTAPSSGHYTVFLSHYDKNQKRFCGLYHKYFTTKQNAFSLLCYKGNTDADDFTELSIGYTATGDPYTSCITPDASSNSTNIANTSWVRTYCETTKKFAYVDSGGSIYNENAGFVKLVHNYSTSTAPTSDSFGAINQYFSGNKRRGMVEWAWRANSTNCDVKLAIMPYNSDNGIVVVLAKSGSTDYFGSQTDNNLYLGTSSRRWKQLFAVTTTISTSDERLKRSISSIPDDVLDAWADLDFLQFQFADAVEEKGSGARLHTGMVAQRIDEAFRARGLDASRYGLFCYDEWDETPEERDADGNVSAPRQAAGDRYSLRYEEALCMEAACQRRENARLKKRVADLEERLAALELRLGSE